MCNNIYEKVPSAFEDDQRKQAAGDQGIKRHTADSELRTVDFRYDNSLT